MKKTALNIAIILAVSLMIVPMIPMHVTTTQLMLDANPDTITEERVLESLENQMVPSFFENNGQFDYEGVLFFGKLTDGYVGFAKSKIVFIYEDSRGIVEIPFENIAMVSPVGADELGYRTNYFLGDRGSFTDVKGFGSVSYENLWVGVDLIFKISNGELRYELKFAEGVATDDIDLDFLNDNSLFSSGIPVAEVTSNSEGFPPQTEVTMTELLYSTFFGGAGNDRGMSLAVADTGLDTGNVYVVMRTTSDGLHTVGSPVMNASRNGGVDIFVAKFDSTLSNLLYATYVGGGLNDIPSGIGVTDTGAAIITGSTWSTDFPTKNSTNPSQTGYHLYDENLDGTYDAFLLVLSNTGEDIVYSTYIGGNGIEDAYGLYNKQNMVFLTGRTTSNQVTFPLYNPINDTYGGNGDCWVMRVRVTDAGLFYSTYLNGSGADEGVSVAVDSSNYAYVTGNTDSSDFPADTVIGSRTGTDMFVCKIYPLGTYLNYSTIIDGQNNENGNAIAVEGDGTAHITGATNSIYYNTTSNAWNSTFNGGGSDGFYTILNPTGSIIYSTYFGGSAGEGVAGIALDSENNAYITGSTYSDDFPIVNGIDNSRAGWNDVFIMKFSPYLVTYSTYIGGTLIDNPKDIFLNGTDFIYITGYTNDTGLPYPTTTGAFNQTHGGGEDAFISCHHELVSPTLSSPADLSFDEDATGSLTEVTWTTSEMHPHIYRIVGNGTHSQDWQYWTTTDITVSFEGETPGLYEYTLIVQDDYGNEASDTIYVEVIDVIGPTFHDGSLDPEAPEYTDVVNVTFYVTDPYSTISTVKLRYQTKPLGQSEFGALTNVTMTHLAGDQYQGLVPAQSFGTGVKINAWANDSVGNTREIENFLHYTVDDTVNPEISNVEQTPTGPECLDNVAITVNATDSGSGIAHVGIVYRVKELGGTWTDESVVLMSHQTGSIYAGQIPGDMLTYAADVEYRIEAIDEADNTENTSVVSFTIADTINPAISNLEHTPEMQEIGSSMMVSAEITELGGVTEITLSYSVNSGDWIDIDVTVPTNMTISANRQRISVEILSQSADATVEFRFSVTDRAGHTAVSETSEYHVKSYFTLENLILLGTVVGALSAIGGVIIKIKNRASR
ncbi:MAG: SBBP repeat-containing protein [Candidatus Thorarchaeota archaeon]